MSQSVVPFRPPLLLAVDEIGLLLDEVADLHPMYLTTSQKQELLVAVERQTSRLAALKSKALAAAGDVADAHGTRHAGAWLAHETRQDPPEGRRAQRLAEGLDQRWPILAEAYGAGSVSTAQTRVIGRREEGKRREPECQTHPRLGGEESRRDAGIPAPDHAGDDEDGNGDGR